MTVAVGKGRFLPHEGEERARGSAAIFGVSKIVSHLQSVLQGVNGTLVSRGGARPSFHEGRRRASGIIFRPQRTRISVRFRCFC